MIEIHQDVVNIVQAKFLSAEVVKCIHLNVTLVDGSWDNSYRILALVEYKNSFALFVLISEKPKPESFSDLSIETAIPIDEYFSCDTEPIFECQSQLIFIINTRERKLQFKIKIGIESSNFASEVIRSKEISVFNHTVDQVWLQKYIAPLSQKKCPNMDPLDSDIPITKQRIAQGQTTVNRESMLRYQLKLKEPEFTEKQEFTIFVGTWNVNGQPPTIPLTSWLNSVDNPPDLYAVGFQELDLSKEAFLFNDTPREAEWLKAVQDAVSPKAKYRLVALSRLVGMQLIVLINYKHYPFVKNCAVETVGTGILGKMGNKGGVSVRLELHNTSLCFVNSHLAAHVEEFERRNQDYKDINARIIFKRNPQGIKDHDQIYWLGDLNYRMTDLSNTQVKTLLQKNELTTLLKCDQLNQQKEKRHVFLDYTEADITFHPTYKFDLNTDVYDTSEKARAPAWTDRILFRGKGINQINYRSYMDLRISDHKPVSALFKSEISVVDEKKYRKIHEDLLKKMDKHENEFLPQVTVDPIEVKYDLVKFREPQTREIIIANTGVVPAEFAFIPKLNEKSYCKEWARITPYYGSVNPGEKCDVRIEVNLESDVEKLYDILILHLKGGKDIFIQVSGSSQKSCFTSSITALCKMSVPIMHMPQDQLKSLANQSTGVHYSVPREIWLLVDHLYRHGMKTRELFESCALHEELIRIRDWLDFGSHDPLPGTVQATAESLLLFLAYTKDPIIPYELQESCILAANNFQNCRQILSKLPDLHKNVFLYICMFLQEFLKHSSENGYDPKTLASLFGDIMLRHRERNLNPQATRGKSNFVYNFLVNDLSSCIISNK